MRKYIKAMKQHLVNITPKETLWGGIADSTGLHEEHDTPVLSVIVPSYNVEEWIERCIDSLEHQSGIDLEIIIVNDGSSDNTPQKINQVAEQYGNIRIINQKNQGLYRARINGVQNAQGDYVTFVDADDYIEYNFYQKPIKRLKEEDADILEFGIKKISGEKEIYIFSPVETMVNSIDAIKRLFMKDNSSCSNCNKIYRRSLFDDVYFNEHIIRCYEEDKLINVKVMCAAKKMMSISDVGYIYDTRNDSITTSKITKESLNVLQTAEITYNYILRNRPEASHYSGLDYCAHLAYWYMNLDYMEIAESDRKDIKNRIQKKFRFVCKNENLTLCSMNIGSRNRRVMLILFYLNPWLAVNAYKMVRLFQKRKS